MRKTTVILPPGAWQGRCSLHNRSSAWRHGDLVTGTQDRSAAGLPTRLTSAPVTQAVRFCAWATPGLSHDAPHGRASCSRAAQLVVWTEVEEVTPAPRSNGSLRVVGKSAFWTRLEGTPASADLRTFAR